MSSTHSDPLYFRNARIVRSITRQRLEQGLDVRCIGCGYAIQPGQAFDVGHIRDAHRGGSNELSNLGPQHRRENRRAGGRAGAIKTNEASRRAKRLPTW